MSYFDFQEDCRMGLFDRPLRMTPLKPLSFGPRTPQFRRSQAAVDAANRAEDARAEQLNDLAWEAGR